MSLRFLAWHLLKQDIQLEMHCSVEDAKTALAIYKKYLEIKESGRIEEVLNEVYSVGRLLNWKVGSS